MRKSRLLVLDFIAIIAVLVGGSCRFSPNFLSGTSVPDQPVGPRLATIALPSASSEPNHVTRISEIQGAQHRSPMDGLEVHNVSGIVTALTGSGFYLQDPFPDNDPATSEGILVVYGIFGKVSIGDSILINSGKVREFNPKGIGENSLTITQIVTKDIKIISGNNPLPEPVVLGRNGRAIPDQVIENDAKGFMSRDNIFDPDEDGIDFYESLESMRVQINDAIAINTVSSYREVAVVADRGADAGDFAATGVILLREDDQNPERLILDDQFINMPKVRLGAKFVRPIIGIVTYDYGYFRVSPTQKIVFDQAPKPDPVVEALNDSARLSVVTYNVENLDGLTNPSRVKQLAQQIVKNLGAPDLIGLQEIQDNDGVGMTNETSADRTIESVIDAILSFGGPKYRYLNIDPVLNADGGQDGGNIRVVILYRTDRGLSLPFFKPGSATQAVEVMNRGGKPTLSLNPGRIEPDAYAFQRGRKPLAAMFRFNGQDLFVVVNHFKSKGGDGPLYGDEQPPRLVTEAQRVLQAEAVNRFVSKLTAIDPDANIIVMGDLNDFPWSKAVKTLESDQLANIYSHIPKNDHYTYIHEGNGQVLDYILMSPRLEKLLDTGFPVHLNTALLPDEKLSDHDPLIAVFDFSNGQ